MTEKSPEAFRTISEVAEELDVPQHVLRFWETRFAQIKPMKRGGGRRYYRPEDVNLLKGIRHLLYGEGYTIKGVQRILKEQGVRHVASIWEIGVAESAEATPPQAPVDALPEPEPVERPRPAPRPSVQPSVAQSSVAQPASAEPRAPAPPQAPPVAAPQPRASEPARAPAAPAPRAGLAPEEIRQLKAALFELIECKRLLESAT